MIKKYADGYFQKVKPKIMVEKVFTTDTSDIVKEYIEYSIHVKG